MSGARDRRVFVCAAVRTAVGSFGGGLASVPPCDLATCVAAEAIARAGVTPEVVGTVMFGNVIATEPRDMYLSRVAALGAGLPETTPAMNVNRLCGSGLQALVSGMQALRMGDAEVALVGGAEVMSRAPHATVAARFGTKMGDLSLTDMLIGTLTDPFGHGHMGVTAENVADGAGIDRDRQDAFALESHRRAVAAIAEGRFADQIVPVEIATRRGTTIFNTDEHVRADVTPEDLASLRPVFRKGGSVTAGNASGINDGAAALILATEDAVARHGLTPLAEVIGYAHAGVAPETMGLGPIPAVRALCDRHGFTPGDFDVVESNEAFASQACAVSDKLGFDPARVNPNGGAIALGHPVGATGAILATKLIHELRRTDAELGLATMCIGGGQGIAVAFRRTGEGTP